MESSSGPRIREMKPKESSRIVRAERLRVTRAASKLVTIGRARRSGNPSSRSLRFDGGQRLANEAGFSSASERRGGFVDFRVKDSRAGSVND